MLEAVRKATKTVKTAGIRAEEAPEYDRVLLTAVCAF
jgi:hypothetical protein